MHTPGIATRHVDPDRCFRFNYWEKNEIEYAVAGRSSAYRRWLI